MLPSVDSRLAWRVIQFLISTARPVSVLLWTVLRSFLPPASAQTENKRHDSFCHRHPLTKHTQPAWGRSSDGKNCRKTKCTYSGDTPKSYFPPCLVVWDENILKKSSRSTKYHCFFILFFPFKAVFELVTKGTKRFKLKENNISFVFTVIFKYANLCLSFSFFLSFDHNEMIRP